MINIDKFKNEIFGLNTRKFGNVVEIIIHNLIEKEKDVKSVNESLNLSYDRIIEYNAFTIKKSEIKGSKALIKSKTSITRENIFRVLVGNNIKKIIDFKNRLIKKWDCNIQQIKTKLFDILYYSIFFDDCILVFKITPDKIKSDRNLNYSNKQHRGNEGEGQFHVTNKNIDYHIANYLYKRLTYEELYDELSNI